jgi:hypothetical protein
MNPWETAKTFDSQEYADDISGYAPYVINKKMSLSVDTFKMASEMNLHHGLDNRLQYDFYFYSIRPRKNRPFKKWLKVTKDEKLELIMKAFGYNRQKAKQVMNILSSTQIKELEKELLIEGGGT